MLRVFTIVANEVIGLSAAVVAYGYEQLKKESALWML